MRTVTRLHALVDWDTSRRACKPVATRKRAPTASEEFDAIRHLIASALTRWRPKAIFRVDIRLYHGWHRGKTPTDDRKVLERMDPQPLQLDSVSFSSGFKFGNELLCGGDRCLLYDTLRSRPDNAADEQKMVDTAMVADLLQLARTSDRERVLLVVGDDDDLLPGVFTADAWATTVLVLRVQRTHDNRFLNASPLIIRGEIENE